MASTTAALSNQSLPCKKRKASNAGSSVGTFNNEHAHSSVEKGKASESCQKRSSLEDGINKISARSERITQQQASEQGTIAETNEPDLEASEPKTEKVFASSGRNTPEQPSEQGTIAENNELDVGLSKPKTEALSLSEPKTLQPSSLQGTIILKKEPDLESSKAKAIKLSASSENSAEQQLSNLENESPHVEAIEPKTIKVSALSEENSQEQSSEQGTILDYEKVDVEANEPKAEKLSASQQQASEQGTIPLKNTICLESSEQQAEIFSASSENSTQQFSEQGKTLENLRPYIEASETKAENLHASSENTTQQFSEQGTTLENKRPYLEAIEPKAENISASPEKGTQKENSEQWTTMDNKEPDVETIEPKAEKLSALPDKNTEEQLSEQGITVENKGHYHVASEPKAEKVRASSENNAQKQISEQRRVVLDNKESSVESSEPEAEKFSASDKNTSQQQSLEQGTIPVKKAIYLESNAPIADFEFEKPKPVGLRHVKISEPKGRRRSASDAQYIRQRSTPRYGRKRSYSEAHQHHANKSEGDADDTSTASTSTSSSLDRKIPGIPLAHLKRSVQISEHRLPSKKRKESHDLSVQISEAHLPSKKRKESHDLSFQLSEAQKRKASYDFSVNFEEAFRTRKGSTDSSYLLELMYPRKYSYDGSISIPGLDDPPPLSNYATNDQASHGDDSSTLSNAMHQHHTSHLDISSLEHLDAMGTGHLDHAEKPNEHGVAYAKKMAAKGTGDDDDYSEGNSTFGSSGHQLLIEAIMMSNGGASVTGDKSTTGPSLETHSFLNNAHHNNREHHGVASTGRDRLESWGGMSDLSLPLGADSAAALVAAGSWHPEFSTGDPADSFLLDDKHSAVPSRIMMGRDRLNSLASLSEASVGAGGGDFPALPNMDVSGVVDVGGGDIQAFVAAAMASVGDQLAELAVAAEGAANSTHSIDSEKFKRELGLDDSDADTMVSSPILGAIPDTKSGGRQRSLSISSGKISVDYEAVQAAVDAAEAASGTLGLTPSKQGLPTETPSTTTGGRSKKSSKVRAKRHLPLKRSRANSQASSGNADDADLKKIRERARAAAGYKPSKTTSVGTQRKSKSKKSSHQPIKKRAKRASPAPKIKECSSDSPTAMEIVSNQPLTDQNGTESLPEASSSTSKSKAQKQGQASQKWESMFECLVEFVEVRREEDTKDSTEEEKKEWQWDGNVPTTYKSKDGKALGRWVNNQRSAKSKGTLKDDREQRLIDVGLKWSVLASNSWNEMLEELNIYIKDQTKKGIKWDGNVPTNYQIKTRPESKFAGEDKNLGRWVNRQRSMYQAGKLRKDRQLALEKIGLKWSMLATTSWDSMFDTLCEYVAQQKKEVGSWDGNVPATYRTNDNPPRALGRWINRQRSAYMKNKLKKEYVDKLNGLGLKWSVHQRQGDNDYDDDGDSDSDTPKSGTKSKGNEKTVVAKEESRSATTCNTQSKETTEKEFSTRRDAIAIQNEAARDDENALPEKVASEKAAVVVTQEAAVNNTSESFSDEKKSNEAEQLQTPTAIRGDAIREREDGEKVNHNSHAGGSELQSNAEGKSNAQQSEAAPKVKELAIENENGVSRKQSASTGITISVEKDEAVDKYCTILSKGGIHEDKVFTHGPEASIEQQITLAKTKTISTQRKYVAKVDDLDQAGKVSKASKQRAEDFSCKTKDKPCRHELAVKKEQQQPPTARSSNIASETSNDNHGNHPRQTGDSSEQPATPIKVVATKEQLNTQKKEAAPKLEESAFEIENGVSKKLNASAIENDNGQNPLAGANENGVSQKQKASASETISLKEENTEDKSTIIYTENVTGEKVVTQQAVVPSKDQITKKESISKKTENVAKVNHMVQAGSISTASAPCVKEASVSTEQPNQKSKEAVQKQSTTDRYTNVIQNESACENDNGFPEKVVSGNAAVVVTREAAISNKTGD